MKNRKQRLRTFTVAQKRKSSENSPKLTTSTFVEPKPLFLILQAMHFAPIIAGKKTIEYREASPHNISRLCSKDKIGRITGFRNYETVIFQAGYTKEAKRLTVEVKKMEYYGGIIEIHLGNVLEKNYVDQPAVLK